MARIVIDKALAGNAVAARFVVGRLMPRPRGREIQLDLPAGGSASDVLAASNATVQAMAAGKITPEEALLVTRVLDGRLRALKAAARERAKDPARAKESPSPLAEESRHEGAVTGLAAERQPSPHLPIAAALGPFLSRKGRGEGVRDDLYSACILQQVAPPPPSLTGAPLAA